MAQTDRKWRCPYCDGLNDWDQLICEICGDGRREGAPAEQAPAPPEIKTPPKPEPKPETKPEPVRAAHDSADRGPEMPKYTPARPAAPAKTPERESGSPATHVSPKAPMRMGSLDRDDPKASPEREENKKGKRARTFALAVVFAGLAYFVGSRLAGNLATTNIQPSRNISVRTAEPAKKADNNTSTSKETQPPKAVKPVPEIIQVDYNRDQRQIKVKVDKKGFDGSIDVLYHYGRMNEINQKTEILFKTDWESSDAIQLSSYDCIFVPGEPYTFTARCLTDTGPVYSEPYEVSMITGTSRSSVRIISNQIFQILKAKNIETMKKALERPNADKERIFKSYIPMKFDISPSTTVFPVIFSPSGYMYIKYSYSMYDADTPSWIIGQAFADGDLPVENGLYEFRLYEYDNLAKIRDTYDPTTRFLFIVQ